MLVSSLKRLLRRRGQFTLGGLCGCCGSTTICAFLCDGTIPMFGATIAVSGVGSCTTPLSGGPCCTIAIPSSGTYFVTVTDSHGTTVYSQNTSLTAGAPNDIIVATPTGYCCQTDGVTMCPVPEVNMTLSYSYTGTCSGSGSLTMTWYPPGPVGPGWFSPGCFTCGSQVNAYEMTCAGGNAFPFFAIVLGGSCTPPFSGIGAGCDNSTQLTVNSVTCGPGFIMTMSGSCNVPLPTTWNLTVSA